MIITKELVEEHGLTPEEYTKVVEHLGGREPNINELGVFSVMWSEHCSYKSSRKHLGKLPTEGPDVMQGPGENAGIIDIGDGMAAVFKMESHNHPSFIEPYQGAATGVGGIMRDVFTMGARPVANLNSLRFGAPEEPRTRYLLDGVVEGIAGYGNCMGVPTVGGEAYFHDSYNGNCLVNAMTVGLVKHERIFKGTASGVGNPVMYVGSRTGRDGIHGATMASDVFDEGSDEKRPTVQVGDPFQEKLLLEACLEVFKTPYIVGIQDMGAAGLTSSGVEMASRAGNGIEIDSALVPQREEGMTPYEVLLSESQERMLLVAHKGKEEDVAKIFRKWGLEVCVIGKVTDTNMFTVLDDGEVAVNIPVAALTDAAPKYDRPIARPDWQDEAISLDLSVIAVPEDMNGVLLKLLASFNITSRRWIFEQYDHMVRTDSVVLPGSDAAIIRVKGTNKGLAMTVDCNSRYCYLDPFTGGAIAVAEAARNITVSGGKPMALTDCLNFGSPERPGVMWQFEQALKGMTEACNELSTPVIGGNVSFYNENSETAIYPTPTIGMVGIVEDLEKHTTRQWFRDEGDVIVFMGSTLDELGGSEYLKVVHGLDKGMPPVLDLQKEKNLQQACRTAITGGIIRSAHDCSEGGIAVTLAESCLAPGAEIGAVVELDLAGLRGDSVLFAESQSRIVVTIKEADLDELEKIAKACNNVPVKVIGRVGGTSLKINDMIDVSLTEISDAHSNTLERFVS
ncbi:Phosphoribosylformylglycinamidine synthase, synthetase subunit [hydrothermal vent metagenome]|uniref:Phosphoribosylformylglycinamidine synthase, synthetase subunit n=1 Tax=hydrothermal vent metagenome TaxID=652676 RepID=A0A3B0RBE1_9ZZZZ